MDQTDQKRARSKFFSVDVWTVFGPPSGKKKEIWFMLKHGQNSRFNFHIIEKLSAPWWLRWKEKNLFDPMGFLWDVYWPHWPSLVQIRGPPWVRHESLAPRISVKYTLWLKWLSFLNFSTVSVRFGPQHVQRYMILVRLFEKLVSQPSRSNASGVWKVWTMLPKFQM